MGQPNRKQKPESSAPEAPLSSSATVGWQKPQGLSRRGWWILGAFILLMQVPLIHRALRGPPPAPVQIPYQDGFNNPAQLKSNYWSSGGFWRIKEGELWGPGPKNNPLWL